MESKKPYIISYKNELYDLTEFMKLHPGGINTLKGLENSDIEPRMHNATPHSDAAMYLMKEYKIRQKNGVKKINGLNGFKNKESEETIDSRTDDSMEHLVDWNKPMLLQVGKLSNDYDKWVNLPVDRPLILFGSWLEYLTKTPWWVVPAFWTPAIFYLISTAIKDSSNKYLELGPIIFNILFGMVFWTLLEYLLHRFLFHKNTAGQSKYVITLHFMIHGLHHKVPFDEYRLVFPPVPAIIIASLIYMPIQFIFSHPVLIVSGGLIGYLAYDMTHFYLHNGNPRSGHFYKMKRYHYQHHFVHHDKGFGISSDAWDNVFGTKIVLSKLKYVLNWK